MHHNLLLLRTIAIPKSKSLVDMEASLIKQAADMWNGHAVHLSSHPAQDLAIRILRESRNNTEKYRKEREG